MQLSTDERIYVAAEFEREAAVLTPINRPDSPDD